MSTLDDTDTTTPESHIPTSALGNCKVIKHLSPSGFRLFTGFYDRLGFDENQRLALLGCGLQLIESIP